MAIAMIELFAVVIGLLIALATIGGTIAYLLGMYRDWRLMKPSRERRF